MRCSLYDVLVAVDDVNTIQRKEGVQYRYLHDGAVIVRCVYVSNNSGGRDVRDRYSRGLDHI